MTNAADWRGAVGDVWAVEWRRTDRSFAGLAEQLDAAILAAAPVGRGQALDIGCGAGATSLALAAKRPDLAVLGVDVSADLVEVARQRADRAGLANVRFATADLNADLSALPAADLLYSRHGVMFADDPAVMFADLHAHARSGAMLIFSCFRTAVENPWASTLVAKVVGTPSPPPPPTPPTPGYAPGPFAFADPTMVGAVLRTAGWRDPTCRAVDYAYVAGAGADPVADAAGFFGRIGPVASAIRSSDDADAALLARLADALARRHQDGRVTFPAAAWIWMAQA